MTIFKNFSLKKEFVRAIVTFGYIGFAPKFPGTIASFATIFFIVCIQFFFGFSGYLTAIIFFIVSTILGFFMVDWSAKQIFNHSDPKQVVLDEVAGMSLTLAVVPFYEHPPSFISYMVAFIFFRFFDIVKPFPVSFFDSRHKRFFIVLDDLVAAILSWPFVFFVYHFLVKWG